MKVRLLMIGALLASGCGSSSAAPEHATEDPTCKAGQYILGDACAPLTIGGPPRSDAGDDADASDGAVTADASDGSDATANEAGSEAGTGDADAGGPADAAGPDAAEGD